MPQKKKKENTEKDNFIAISGGIAVVLAFATIAIISLIVIVQGGTVSISLSGLLIMAGFFCMIGGAIGWILYQTRRILKILWRVTVSTWRAIVSLINRIA